MSKTIHWGIIGLGKIARKFAEDLKFVPNCELTAVASRDLDKAQVFANDFGAKYFYGSYEEITSNPAIDVIYIATPHHLHYENTVCCLENKKAVLCEKPFAMNLRQVQEMVALARKEEVFLMEALWTKFLPSFQKVNEIIKNGLIGEINMVQADFSFKANYNPESRLFDKALGGGSLLDIGIYPLFLATTLLGKPKNIKAMATFDKTGADVNCGMVLQYNSGQMAILSSSFHANGTWEANILGREGRIQMTFPFHGPKTQINLIRNFNEIETIPFETQGNGYNYEADHVNECLRNGKLESEIMSQQDSLFLMEMLDWVRREAHILY